MRTKNTAFTLVELMVVILIIVIIAAILAPSVVTAKKVAESMRTKSIISALSAGIQQYKLDTGYFPGQRDPSVVTSGTYANCAAKFLAHALLTPKGTTNYPQQAYCDFTREMLIKPDDPNPNTGSWNDAAWQNYWKDCVFTDARGDKDHARPILYYPARIGSEGSLAQFQYSDNSIYTDSDPKDALGLTVRQRWDGVANTRWPFAAIDDKTTPPFSGTAKPVRDTEYLLVGAGPDGVFFTDDDVKNW